MTDDSFESYWQGISVELREVFGQPGADLPVSADQVAEHYHAGITTAHAALEIAAANGLSPAND